MNNKGFTLVELLATIALLAVIAIISFVSINGVLKKSKVNDCEILVSNIKSAAKNYVSDNRYNLEVSNGKKKLDENEIRSVETAQGETANFIMITGDKLSSYLSGDLTNPFTKERLDEDKINILIVINDDYTAGDVFVGYESYEEIDCNSNEW